MKTTSAPLRALLDLAGRIAGFLFGHISWSAPPWLRGISRCLKDLGGHMAAHRRGWSAGITAVALLAGGSWLTWRWWESHRPRVVAYEEIQKVEVKWEPPARAALGVLALLLGNLFIVGINQIYDVKIDVINKPFLPIAAGRISPRAAWWLVACSGLTGLAIVR